MSFRLPLTLAMLIAVLAMAGPATATVFIAMSDAELADTSEVIVEGRVTAIEPAPGERPATDYLIEIGRPIKGFLPGTAIVVRVPGGVRADGVGLRIWGAPELQANDEALFFLTPRSDGTFALSQFLLGLYHIETAVDTTRRLALRDLSEALALAPADKAPARDGIRDLTRFRSWLIDRAAGKERSPDYFVDRLDPSTSVDKFTTVVSSTEPAPLGCGANGGRSVRWFDFDTGDSVFWSPHSSGQSGLADGGAAALATALAAWNATPATAIRFAASTPSDATAGLGQPDGVNTLLFGDPFDEIGGAFNGTGILAIGGPWFLCDLSERGEMSFHPTIEADIVTQDGLELFFAASAEPERAAEELFAHELGHTLGLAHSLVPEALMFAQIHDDGRGAALDEDDVLGAQFLYGQQTDFPAAPTNLWAAPLSDEKIRLRWQDNADNEISFRIEVQTTGSWIEIPFDVPADLTTVNITGLTPENTYSFRVRAVGGAGASLPSNVAQAMTFADEPPCTFDDHQLCLLGGRFAVEVRYRNQHADGAEGLATAAPATDQSGFFWFFGPENLELTVKLLDGTGFNQHFWVSYGALSDLEYWIRVTDTVTGTVREYYNPPGEICGQTDVTAFASDQPPAPQPVPGSKEIAMPEYMAVELLSRETPAGNRRAKATATPCVTDPRTLCLVDRRFRVEVDWTNQHDGGSQGTGQAVAGTDNTGFFWFFGPQNLELVLKILDGRGLNDHFWVFYGSLSDVEYRITVTDLETGEVRSYHNPPGRICGLADIEAFAATPGAP